MNLASDGYLGQLNFNYTASDGTSQKFTGPLFNVDNSPQSRAVTWSQELLAGPTSSASAEPRTATSASMLTLSASPITITTSYSPTSLVYPSATSPSPSSSKPSSTGDSRLGTGAIVGIVVGIVGCAGLVAALVLYWRKRPNTTQAGIRVASPTDFQSPVPRNFIAEKDGSPLRPPELSGDSQLLEMPTGYHREENKSTIELDS